MKGHCRGQQGAILVLTAFLLPFIIAFTGMAVDFGSAYVRRSQLQNAADAAALAGAYHLDDNQADDVVLKYLKTNLDPHFTSYSYQTGDDFPDKFETLNYHTDKQKDELDVTLRSSVEASFLKLFDIDTIPVYATAKAKVSKGKESLPADDMFNYAITVANKSYETGNPSIFMVSSGMNIKGNILTNGSILFWNDRVNTLDGKIYSAVPLNKQVWSNKAWDNKPLAFATTDGKTFTDIHDYNKNNGIADIRIDSNSGIEKMIRNYHDMAIKDREKEHIYYDDRPNKDYNFSSSHAGVYPDLCPQGDTIVSIDDAGGIPPENRYYRVIIVSGNISVSFEHSPPPKDNEYLVLISLHGSITVPNDIPLNAMIYAPEGTVTINGNAAHVRGSIVAQTLYMSSGGQTITGYNFFKEESGLPGTSGEKKVSLIK